MIVRFGYVAMSTLIQNASPSKTMTAKQFMTLTDRKAAVRKLERIAAENVHNTLRLLRHNRANGIRLYRMSSRLIPLWGIGELADWDPLEALADEFAELGNYAKQHKMRLGFHPDHYTVLNAPKPEVLQASLDVLDKHVRMLEAMGLDENAKCNIHVGGSYGNKVKALDRFVRQFEEVPPRIRTRLTLENDDKTFTAKQTLELCETIGIPMVLDLHHHLVNNDGEEAVDLWPRIARTWDEAGTAATEEFIGLPALPPKIHVSSPKSEKEPRAHADYVDPGPLLDFLRGVAGLGTTPCLDVMIEAKMKDGALFQLMEELPQYEGVTLLEKASVQLDG